MKKKNWPCKTRARLMDYPLQLLKPLYYLGVINSAKRSNSFDEKTANKPTGLQEALPEQLLDGIPGSTPF